MAQRQKSQHWLGSHARTLQRTALLSSSSIPPLRPRCSDSLLVAAESAVSRARQHHSARSHAILMAASPPSSAQPRLGLHPFSIPPPPPPVLIHNISPFQHLLCIHRLASPSLASSRSSTLDLRIRSLPRKQGRPLHNKVQQSLSYAQRSRSLSLLALTLALAYIAFVRLLPRPFINRAH